MVSEIQLNMRRRIKNLHNLILEQLQISEIELTDPEDITKRVPLKEWLETIENKAVFECFDEHNIEIITQAVKTIVVHVQDIIARNIKDEFEKTVQVVKMGDMKIDKLKSQNIRFQREIDKLKAKLANIPTATAPPEQLAEDFEPMEDYPIEEDDEL